MTKRATFRTADLNRALDVAEKRGLAVASYEITPDGTIRVLTAPPGSTPPSADQDDSAWAEAMGKWRRSA